MNIVYDYQYTNFTEVDDGLAFDFIFYGKVYRATITGGTNVYLIKFEGEELYAKSISILPCSFDEIPKYFEILLGLVINF